MNKRIRELDVLRGVMILGVVLVHLLFDLDYFLGIDVVKNPILQYCLDRCGFLFVVLSGMSVTLGRHNIRRGLLKNESFPEALAAYCLADFKVPPTKSNIFKSVLPGKAGDLVGDFIGRIIGPRPTLKQGACIACGKCENMCPAKAIVMKNNVPHINRSKCIGCFCCQEFCPKGALEAKRPPIARLLSK